MFYYPFGIKYQSDHYVFSSTRILYYLEFPLGGYNISSFVFYKSSLAIYKFFILSLVLKFDICLKVYMHIIDTTALRDNLTRCLISLLTICIV